MYFKMSSAKCDHFVQRIRALNNVLGNLSHLCALYRSSVQVSNDGDLKWTAEQKKGWIGQNNAQHSWSLQLFYGLVGSLWLNQASLYITQCKTVITRTSDGFDGFGYVNQGCPLTCWLDARSGSETPYMATSNNPKHIHHVYNLPQVGFIYLPLPSTSRSPADNSYLASL